MKSIAILGSTGSIGSNVLEVVRQFSTKFNVEALAAKSQISLLEKQALEFQPKLVAVYDKDKALELQKRLPNIEVIGGIEGLNAVAALDSVDQVISAMTGTLGLIPTITAIQAGKNIALANKEALVSGGALVISLAKKSGVSLIPIDSEHSAIFQCLEAEKNTRCVKRLILTASGGPFRAFTKNQLNRVTIHQALCHPTWKMGDKITIDCSTLMNKGLEVIEAYWLFDIPLDQIEVVIHPQSIIHSMVEFWDGSILAQMGEPSMLTPIQYAMTYPERQKRAVSPFDFLRHPTLEFALPDLQKFPCLRLAYQALRQGKSFPCYMNAANEALVERSLKKEISWSEISSKLEILLERHLGLEVDTLEKILEVDAEAKKEAAQI